MSKKTVLIKHSEYKPVYIELSNSTKYIYLKHCISTVKYGNVK